MTENNQDKSEKATPFKLEEARKKGMVPKSMELSSFLVLLIFLSGLLMVLDAIAASSAASLQDWILAAAYPHHGVSTFLHLGQDLVSPILLLLVPMIILIVVAVIVMNWVFHGVVFSLVPLKPDFKRLNPVAGIKKIFSKKMLVELLKVVLKIILMLSILGYLLWNSIGHLIALSVLDPSQFLSRFHYYLTVVVIAILAVMLLAALFDIWYSKFEYAKQMRMSQRDIKDEYKRREGSPEVKSKRKQIQQELLKKIKALQQIKQADVIVTNPTHYAIALRYRRQEMAAPMVVAIGRGGMAQLIMRLARRHQIPILRQPPLARKLYKIGVINHMIPPETQPDVVKVYQWVLSLPHHQVDI